MFSCPVWLSLKAGFDIDSPKYSDTKLNVGIVLHGIVEMRRMMTFAEKDSILKERIESTYKTDDMVAWLVNRLQNSPHPQFANLRKKPEYTDMLNKMQ